MLPLTLLLFTLLHLCLQVYKNGVNAYINFCRGMLWETIPAHLHSQDHDDESEMTRIIWPCLHHTSSNSSSSIIFINKMITVSNKTRCSFTSSGSVVTKEVTEPRLCTRSGILLPMEKSHACSLLISRVAIGLPYLPV